MFIFPTWLGRGGLLRCHPVQHFWSFVEEGCCEYSVSIFFLRQNLLGPKVVHFTHVMSKSIGHMHNVLQFCPALFPFTTVVFQLIRCKRRSLPCITGMREHQMHKPKKMCYFTTARQWGFKTIRSER